jgi:hypothetical protein
LTIIARRASWKPRIIAPTQLSNTSSICLPLELGIVIPIVKLDLSTIRPGRIYDSAG